ncbi:hypothetical protein LINPERHAP2_LOCUS34615 [Linum perenne]
MERANLGGGARSREADRISELPDEIIHEILDRLKYSQTTLALSRRWMQIWLSYPILEFHCNGSCKYSAKLKSFVAAAARKLSSSSQHNRIKALRISSKCSDFIRDLLDLIVDREPEEIVVKGKWNQSYQLFPTQLINNPRLRILDLLGCKFWEFPDTNQLDMRMINLRVLRLKHFIIDERLLNCLIAASPLLEELKLCYPRATTIGRLHICNNPNLKILQLEDCIVEELIQIAGTTKSLETMSLSCSDLDISPSQLSSLKSLKICNACLEFINNMIANSPSLQSLSLSLYLTRKEEELKIRSDTLQKLDLVVKGAHQMRLLIDAPRLVNVDYRAYLDGGRSRGADRISELPDEIIHEIMNRLKYSQTTLALSRRWMQIWLSYPILEFHCDESFKYSAKLKSFVAAAAIKLSSSSQHNRIKALRISSKCSDFIRDLLDLIVNREPEEIAVRGCWSLLTPILATDLINNHKLRILDLEACKFWEYQDTNHLDMRMINLRVLHLEHVSIGELLLNRLIAGSPLLEELNLSLLMETIGRLHICSNPNLKILQLQNCIVQEFIQIAGTTKSLERMSIQRSLIRGDLDISPSRLTSLKSLKIDNTYKLTDEDINNLIANSPSLQSLCLSYIGKIEELKIRSDTLQQLELKHCLNRMRVYIDAPRLVDVHYHGWLHRLPAITRPANLREAQLCTFIVSLNPDISLFLMNNFIKLKDILAKLRQQFRSVHLRFNLLTFSGDVVDFDHGSPIPMIDSVEFEFDFSTMHGKESLIDALFWSCHPRYFCLTPRKELYRGGSSLTYMAESFINRGNSDDCCKSGYKCWRHQLKDVKIIQELQFSCFFKMVSLVTNTPWKFWLSRSFAVEIGLLGSDILIVREKRCPAFISDVLDLIVNRREPEEIVVRGYKDRWCKLFDAHLINNPKLRILDLCYCKFWELISDLHTRMINLRVLHLKHVSIHNEHLNRLIAASPLLEELKLGLLEETIGRLHICNNPNLKILQLENCTVWELIQIAGTTKSLETMSIQHSSISIDLDNSPSRLSSLKSVKIYFPYKFTTGELISNMIANSPSLQSLSLYQIGKQEEEVKIRSDTLRRLDLLVKGAHQMRLLIDAPRLVNVDYRGFFLPAITHPADLQEAQPCTFTVHIYNLHLKDFIKLKDFLAKLRQQFQFVRFVIRGSSFFYEGKDKLDWDQLVDGSSIPMIQHVKFEFDLIRLQDRDGFMSSLFSSCHPNYLCIMHYTFRGECPSLKCMAEIFMNRNSNNCCRSGRKCWHQQLKDVKIVSGKKDEGDEQLSEISSYVDWTYSHERVVWLKLIWHEESLS